MDFYDILGVKREATQLEISRAYKRLVLRCHPDKGGCQEQFHEVTRAYQEPRPVSSSSGWEGPMSSPGAALPPLCHAM